MNRFLILILSFGIVCTAPSCKLYRRITGKKKPVASVNSDLPRRDSAQDKPDLPPAPSPDLRQQALLTALLPHWTAETPWRTFNAKAKGHYEGKGEDHDFTANIRMEKGKRIWLSVVGLGVFEFARILITPDTVQILNRINKEARVLPFSQLSSLLPIRGDFASIQNLIIGDVMKTGNQPNMAKDTGAELFISYVSSGLTHELQFSRVDTSLLFQTISGQGAFLRYQYADYVREGGRRFATNRLLTMKDKEEQHTLSLEFTKTGFDEAIETPFSIPEKYDRK